MIGYSEPIRIKLLKLILYMKNVKNVSFIYTTPQLEEIVLFFLFPQGLLI
jgi:hypothetical protein